MSNYTKTTDFAAKDSLPTGDSEKIIRGTEFENEFDAISTAIATKSDIAGPTFTGTLTFETISDGSINVTAFVDEDNMASDSATLVPTQQSVKAYVDSQVTAQDLDFQADSGGALSIDLDSEALTLTGGTGIDTSGSGNAVTFDIDSTVATLTGSQTLTNKTLTSPVLNDSVSGTAVLDEDDMSSNSATQLATQQSIKAYVDTTVAATNEVVEDTTPQLGGDLDLNSNDITGTGNIDVTGTVTADDVSLNTKAVIGGATPRIELFESDTTDVNTRFRNTGGTLQIQSTDDAGTTSQTRIVIDHATGDISFREDTGTDDKFYWDASAESLGIGNTAPQAGVHVTQDATQLILAGAAGSNDKFIAFDVDLIADVNTHFITVDQADALAFGEKLNDNDRVIENEWMRITNSGQVGIGTDAPAETLHVAGNIRIGVSGASELYTNTAELRLGVDRDNDNGTSDITFYADGSEKVRMDKDGHFIVPNGVTLGVAVDAYAASNTLDDYEEGTFTPELADASSGGNTATTSSATGAYTKVGNLAVLNMRFTNINTTGLTGANTLFIRGLPFTNASLAQNQSEGSVRMDLVDVPTGSYSATFATVANATYGSVRVGVDNSNDVQVKVQDISSGSSDIFITIQHFV